MLRPWPRGRTCGRGLDSKELIQLDGGVEVSWAQGADVAPRLDSDDKTARMAALVAQPLVDALTPEGEGILKA